MATITIGARPTNSYPGMVDAALNSSNHDTNYSTELQAAPPFLFRPDLTVLTGPLTVTAAKFTLCVPTGAGTDSVRDISGSDPLNIYRCLRAWVETEVCWDWYAGNTGSHSSWTTAGCKGSGTDRAVSFSAQSEYPGFYEEGVDYDSLNNTQLITDLQTYYNDPTTYAGMSWLFEGVGDWSAPAYALPANATTTIRPYLTITYTTSNGQAPRSMHQFRQRS